MPLYEYRCKNCGHQFDIQQSFTEDSLTVCPSCAEPQLRKVFQPVGITFKGSGFYKNDSRPSSSSTSPSGSPDERSGSSESSSSESQSDSGSTSSDGAKKDSAKKDSATKESPTKDSPKKESASTPGPSD